ILLDLTVGDEIGLLKTLELQLLHRAGQLVAHRLHDYVFRGGGSGRAQEQNGQHPRNHFRCPHGDSPGQNLSSKGGLRIGDNSWDLGFFCTSIWLMRSPGPPAETGTGPDSAPQVPLNAAIRSSAARIRVNTVSGVPMRSTPRTSSSWPST